MEIVYELRIAEIVQTAVSVVAFGVLLYQLRQVARGIRGVTHDSLYTHYNDVCMKLVERPYLRPYFYENRACGPEDPARPDRANEVAAMSEAILGVIEHAVIQRKKLGAQSWTGCWRPYAEERLDRSVELRKFFDPNKAWYTEDMREAMAPLVGGAKDAADRPRRRRGGRSGSAGARDWSRRCPASSRRPSRGTSARSTGSGDCRSS